MILPTNNCYGCRACEQVCVHEAIVMKPDQEGFIFPVVNKDKCIECGLCIKVCSEYQENIAKIINSISTEVYAAWNQDKRVVLESTSGGLSATIAEYIIKQGGVVYGCAWRSDDDLIAIQTRITESKDLYKIKGSKYVQSDTGNSYKLVKKDLKGGRTVLYTGTPCQIAGLRLYLRREYENLITIDLVCHGVPSPKMFKAYIEWLGNKNDSKISMYKFRDQNSNGIIYHSWLQNNKKNKLLLGLVPYSCGFYNSYISRESCFKCVFSQTQRVGDFTLSDFWGAENHHKELKSARQSGLNMVMCNTHKANKVLDKINIYLNLLPSKLEYAVKGDIRLREPDPRPAFRSEAYRILDEKGFDYLQQNFLRPQYYHIKRLIPICVRVLINKLK